jgi:hypothetical protein
MIAATLMWLPFGTVGAAQALAPATGTMAAPLVLKDVEGRQHDLAAYRGRVGADQFLGHLV